MKFELWRVQGTVLARMSEEFTPAGDVKYVVDERWDLTGAKATFEHGANVSATSAAKVMMWGIFALGSTFVKNKVYIVVEWPDGKSVLIDGSAKEEREARIMALEINANSGAVVAATGTQGSGDVLETLKKLGELRDSGVVTSEEFEAKKAELLARI